VELQSQEILHRFPRHIQYRILKFVHFSTTSRIDSLTDELFDELKQRFFTDEDALLENPTGGPLYVFWDVFC
jgi:hypothetical protein